MERLDLGTNENTLREVASAIQLLNQFGLNVELPTDLSELLKLRDVGQNNTVDLENNRENAKLQLADAISVLRFRGLRFKLPKVTQEFVEQYCLFDEHDGLFKHLAKSANIYFEYGCGKSTKYMLTATSAKVFTVDTSYRWLKKTQETVTVDNRDRLICKWIDVGELGDWGHPLSYRKRQSFLEYANWCWNREEQPDLVLIDGRFRLLCFLTCLKRARTGTNILFDDYIDRPHYHVAEEFLKVTATFGRQALFVVSELSKSKVSNQIISEFKNVTD